MVTFREFLSVYDQIREDVAQLQQQSQNYQKQITDLNARLQRLLQLKAQVDKEVSTQTQTQNQQTQAVQGQLAQPQAQAAPGAAVPQA